MRGSAAFRAAVAPGGVLAGPWVKNELWRRAKAVPSLDLRFAENKSLVDATTGQNLVTFTRASSGTYVGSDGLIKTATTNLLLRSEEFDVGWSGIGALLSANTAVSPIGTVTADTLKEDSATGLHIYQNITSVVGLNYVNSVYVKAGTATSLLLRDDTGAGRHIQFNPSTGQITATSGTLLSSGSQAVGDGWFRVWMIYAADATTVRGIIRPASSGSAQTYTVWGAQLEANVTTPGEYIPTTSVINSAPRFDHNPTTGESLGLLVEEQRTNSIRNNTMVGAVAGTPGTNPTNWSYVTTQSNGLTQSIVGTGTENGITYIDYRFNGTTVASPSSIAFGLEATAAAASGQTWTSSIYMRLVAGTSTGISSVQLGLIENNSGGSFVGGALYNIATPTNASLIAQRYSATRTLAAATTAFCAPTIGINVVGSTAMDFTLRIGLPQLEQGAFATSVIPTTTATVTRSADVASITGTNFSSWYRQDEGTVFAEFQVDANLDTIQRQVFTFSDGTTSNRIRYHDRASGVPQFRFEVAGISTTTGLSTWNLGANKIAGSWSASSANFGTNGTLAALNISTLPTVNQVAIGQEITNHINAPIRRLTYWPQRLPNSTLQEVTR